MVGQIGLLSLWVVSSRSGAAWRLCAASIGTALLAAILTTPMNASSNVLGAYALLSFMASLVSCGSVMYFFSRRRAGLRKSRRFQFSIGWMIAITTLTVLMVMAFRLADWGVLAGGELLGPLVIESLTPAMVLAITLFAGTVFRAVYALLALVAVGALVVGMTPSENPLALWLFYLYSLGQVSVVAAWVLGLRARRAEPVTEPIEPLRIYESAPEQTAPDEHGRPPELKRINVVV